METTRWKTNALFVFLIGAASCGTVDPAANPPLLDLFGELSHLRGSAMQYVVDPGEETLLHRARSDEGGWARVNPGASAFGFSDAVHWLRFRVENPSGRATPVFVVIDNEYLDRLDLYGFVSPAPVRTSTSASNNKAENIMDIQAEAWDPAKPISFQKTAGRDFDFYGREVPRRKYAFPVELAAGTRYEFYIAARSRNPMSIPVSIMSDGRYAEYWSMEQLRMGVYAGFFGLLLAASIALFLHFREKIFLIYMGYLALNFSYQFSLQGYAFQYIWPREPGTAAGFTTLVSCYTVIFALWFARQFLDTRARLPRFDRWIQFCMAAAVFLSLLMLVVPAHIVDRINSVFLIPACIIASQYAGIRVWLQGYRPARFYVLAWGGYSFTLIVCILQVYGILPNYVLGVEMLEGLALGTTFEMLFFPFAIADRLQLNWGASPAASPVAARKDSVSDAPGESVDDPADAVVSPANDAAVVQHPATPNQPAPPNATSIAGDAPTSALAIAVAKPVPDPKPSRKSSRIARHDRERVEAALREAMETRRLYREKITLRDLADSLAIPEKDLSKFLNEVVGQSFHDYVNGFRVREACDLLIEDSGRKIVEIAFAVGFNSLSTFHNAFQKSQGLSPRRYREAARVEPRAARS